MYLRYFIKKTFRHDRLTNVWSIGSETWEIHWPLPQPRFSGWLWDLLTSWRTPTGSWRVPTTWPSKGSSWWELSAQHVWKHLSIQPRTVSFQSKIFCPFEVQFVDNREIKNVNVRDFFLHVFKELMAPKSQKRPFAGSRPRFCPAVAAHTSGFLTWNPVCEGNSVTWSCTMILRAFCRLLYNRQPKEPLKTYFLFGVLCGLGPLRPQRRPPAVPTGSL